MIDVLIVGAGPTGLALATALRRLGVSPRLVDAQSLGANTSRAAVIHARTLEVLESLNATTELLQIGVRVPLFRIRERDRVLLEVDFSKLETRFPFALMVPQNRTEHVLSGRLRALGGDIERPIRLTSVTSGLDAVEAILSSTHGEETVNARWIVGCDGANSVVREQLGFAFRGAPYDETFVLADVVMQWPYPRHEVSLFLSPAGLVVVAPLPDSRYRVVATVTSDPGVLNSAFVQGLLDDRGPTVGAKVIDIIWSSCFHLQHRLVDTPRKGPALLCGDAAHVHSPAGGQGMNTGIRDAISLAEPLREALRSGCVDAISAWAKRRHSVAADVVSLTDRMTRVATLKSFASRSLRNFLLAGVGIAPGIGERVARRLAELDYR